MVRSAPFEKEALGRSDDNNIVQTRHLPTYSLFSLDLNRCACSYCRNQSLENKDIEQLQEDVR